MPKEVPAMQRLLQSTFVESKSTLELSATQSLMLQQLETGPQSLLELLAGEETNQLDKRIALSSLAERGWLVELLVSAQGAVLATANKPHIPLFAVLRQNVALTLSPWVFIRPQQGVFLIYAAKNRTSILCSDTHLLSCLTRMEASLYVNDIDSIVLDFLVDHAFLLPVEQVQQLPIPWPFHDALFHDVSTHGRATPGGYGASFPYQGILDPPPLDDPIDSLQENISLPLAGDILPETATLHAILASRRSVRVFTQKPLAILEVGALFDLALRARRTIATPDEHLYSQAYPSGGARSEISTYLIVARGHGLASGVYAYCKLSHALCILQQHDGLATAVLDCLSKPTGVKHSSAAAAVLFVADYQRMAWKYEGMAYAAILRNVGCIYQTVSLSATSLGLGSCALGGGWGQLEETILASFLGEKVIVGAMLIGWPDAD